MAQRVITVDFEKLSKKMNQYSLLVGKEVTQIVYNSSRLCCVELARFTQPYGFEQTARKKGEGAIRNDVRSIAKPLNGYWLKQFQDLFGSGDNSRSLRRKDGSVWLSQTDKLIKTESALYDMHQKLRSKSTGRTSRAGLSGDRVIGRSKARNVAVVSEKLLAKYIKNTAKKAGTVKAGWASAAKLCKADVRVPLRGIPSWVTRNMLSQSASVDSSKASGLGFKVILTNKIKYASSVLSKGNQQIAVNVAKKKMLGFLNAAIRGTKLKEAGLR
jgi:hypothetical protein